MLGVPGPKVVKNLLLLLRAAWSAQQLRHVIDEDGLEVRSVPSTKVTRAGRHYFSIDDVVIASTACNGDLSSESPGDVAVVGDGWRMWKSLSTLVWKQPLRGVLLLLCVLEYSGHGRAFIVIVLFWPWTGFIHLL